MSDVKMRVPPQGLVHSPLARLTLYFLVQTSFRIRRMGGIHWTHQTRRMDETINRRVTIPWKLGYFIPMEIIDGKISIKLR
jgi:hypothetical protein